MSSKEHEDRLGQSETGWAEMQGSEGQAHRAPGPAALPGGKGAPGPRLGTWLAPLEPGSAASQRMGPL